MLMKVIIMSLPHIPGKMFSILPMISLNSHKNLPSLSKYDYLEMTYPSYTAITLNQNTRLLTLALRLLTANTTIWWFLDALFHHINSFTIYLNIMYQLQSITKNFFQHYITQPGKTFSLSEKKFLRLHLKTSRILR